MQTLKYTKIDKKQQAEQSKAKQRHKDYNQTESKL